jgi:hypothetical protein
MKITCFASWHALAGSVEDGKVESESESNGVGGLEFCVGNLRGRLVGSECSISSFFVLVSGSVL